MDGTKDSGAFPEHCRKGFCGIGSLVSGQRDFSVLVDSLGTVVGPGPGSRAFDVRLLGVAVTSVYDSFFCRQGTLSARINSALQRVLDGSQERFALEFPCPLGNGEVFHIQGCAYPAFGPGIVLVQGFDASRAA